MDSRSVEKVGVQGVRTVFIPGMLSECDLSRACSINIINISITKIIKSSSSIYQWVNNTYILYSSYSHLFSKAKAVQTGQGSIPEPTHLVTRHSLVLGIRIVVQVLKHKTA